MFVVPSFSRNTALLTAQRTLVVRVDLNNFTFAYTLQDKVSAIRPMWSERAPVMTLAKGFMRDESVVSAKTAS